jgi:hypothetical protein
MRLKGKDRFKKYVRYRWNLIDWWTLFFIFHIGESVSYRIHNILDTKAFAMSSFFYAQKL